MSNITQNTRIREVRIYFSRGMISSARIYLDTVETNRIEIPLLPSVYPTEGTTEYDNLVALQELYSSNQGFINNSGEPSIIILYTQGEIQGLEALDDHGYYNPFLVGSFEDHLARLLAQSGGSPSSGLAHEYESLLELSPGVRQVPNSKWFDGVHYDGVGGDTLRFQTPTDHVHIEGGHITYFIYNSSNDEALRVENHKGVEETVVEPQHSVDIRIVEEHEGAGSLIVYNEGTYHKDFDETDVSERRWQEAVHWAKREMRKAQAVPRFDRYEYTPQLVQTYSAYVYNTLFVAHNPLNRSTDTKWATIRQNMFTWDFFSRNADGEAVANRVRLDGALNIVHDLENLWVWDDRVSNIRILSYAATDDLPERGLHASASEVYKVLGYVQPKEFSEGKLETFVIHESDGGAEVTWTGEIESGLFSAVVANNVLQPILDITPTYEHSPVTITLPDTLDTLGNLAVGTNVYLFYVTSQDGTEATQYTLIITRLE